MDRNRYIKPPHMYRALQQFGMNLAVAEGDVWRRHRKIVAGSFTEVRRRIVLVVYSLTTCTENERAGVGRNGRDDGEIIRRVGTLETTQRRRKAGDTRRQYGRSHAQNHPLRTSFLRGAKNKGN